MGTCSRGISFAPKHSGHSLMYPGLPGSGVNVFAQYLQTTVFTFPESYHGRSGNADSDHLQRSNYRVQILSPGTGSQIETCAALEPVEAEGGFDKFRRRLAGWTAGKEDRQPLTSDDFVINERFQKPRRANPAFSLPPSSVRPAHRGRKFLGSPRSC